MVLTMLPAVQGAFILLGNNNFGYPLLIVMAMSVFMYVCWRFWEGVTGQGSDDAFGPSKNFFKYRLSPVVSVRLHLQVHFDVAAMLSSPGLVKKKGLKRQFVSAIA